MRAESGREPWPNGLEPWVGPPPTVSDQRPRPCCDSDGTKPTRQRILAGRWDFSHPNWGSVSTEARDLVSRLLVVDSARRVSLLEVLSHAWITSGDREEDEALGEAHRGHLHRHHEEDARASMRESGAARDSIAGGRKSPEGQPRMSRRLSRRGTWSSLHSAGTRSSLASRSSRRSVVEVSEQWHECLDGTMATLRKRAEQKEQQYSARWGVVRQAVGTPKVLLL